MRWLIILLAAQVLITCIALYAAYDAKSSKPTSQPTPPKVKKECKKVELDKEQNGHIIPGYGR